MANIHYAPGSGRDHATRALTVIDALSRKHRVVVHADAEGYELLAPRYHGHERVALRLLPGRRWHQVLRGRGPALRAWLDAASLLDRRWRRDELQRALTSARPDLVFHEDDGLVAEAARRAGLPLLTLGDADTAARPEATAVEVARALARLEGTRLWEQAPTDERAGPDAALHAARAHPAVAWSRSASAAEPATGPRAPARAQPA